VDEIRKERLMISIITVSGIGSVVECLIAGWETWMIPVILVGTVVIWIMHIAQKSNAVVRTYVCFAFGAFLVFFHGMHEISFFDVSIVTLVLMTTFMLSDRANMLNLILIEYAVIMSYQFYLLYTNSEVDITPVTAVRTVLHIGVVLCMYFMGRILVNSRITASRKLDAWKQTVEANSHDMEDFLSNISHELRTPVNVISGMTTLMQKDNDSKELSSIQEACIRLAHQIEDIQDYTEIKRGELHLEEENYMCVSLINDVVSNYKACGRKKDLALIVDMAPETPTMLKGDIQKLHKLFRHLLDNAIKFTRKGGVYVKIFSIPHEYGINLTIEIKDTGRGMTRADMSRLSKGMYQADKKRDRSTGGIGIGLPIVYGFAHKMGGFVNISSTKGHGTTVRISIPQQVVDTAPCLSVGEGCRNGMVFYLKSEKIRVPEVREFYTAMAENLAIGLKIPLYIAGDRRELERLIDDLKVNYIFSGQEEYEADREYIDELSKSGYRIAVTANDGFKTTPGSGVSVLPRPLYAFPVVRFVNGENVSDGCDEAEELTLRGIRALVVDDEPMNLVVASGLLREYGMSVDTVESGRDAIRKYEDEDYDVIYMDHMMPEMDGVEAMRQLRMVADETHRHPVIIALTANALSGAREMFMQEGFDGFIAKPIDLAEFERVMKRVLPEDLKNKEGRA